MKEKKTKSFITLLAIFLISVSTYGIPKIKIPPLEKSVTDLTKTLCSYEISKIEKKLINFDSANNIQIFVLLIPTTKKETIDEYAKRVFEKWEKGGKEAGAGVILVIAQNDRELTIKVSSGLKETINGDAADYIIDEYILPEFRNSNFAGGIENGTNKIISLLNGERLIEPEPEEESIPGSQSGNKILAVFCLILAFFGVSSTLITGKRMRLFLIVFIISLGLTFVGGILLVDTFVATIFSVVAFVFGLLLKIMIYLSSRYGTKTSNTDTYSSGSWTSSSASIQKLGSSIAVNQSNFNDNNGNFKGGGASGSW